MKLEFKLDLSPVSLNSSTFVWNNRRIKTKQAIAFENDFNELMKPYAHSLGLLADSFIDTEHSFSLDYTFYLKTFFTKKGNISAKSKDVDNLVKVVNDRLFKLIGIDDSTMIDLTAKKRPADKDCICITIEMIPICKA